LDKEEIEIKKESNLQNEEQKQISQNRNIENSLTDEEFDKDAKEEIKGDSNTLMNRNKDKNQELDPETIKQIEEDFRKMNERGRRNKIENLISEIETNKKFFEEELEKSKLEEEEKEDQRKKMNIVMKSKETERQIMHDILIDMDKFKKKFIEDLIDNEIEEEKKKGMIMK